MIKSESCQRRRAGAILCVKALRQLVADATAEYPDDNKESLLKPFTDAEQIVKALGPMSPEAEGAIIALAEYIHCFESSGTPELDPGGWRPVVALSPDEFSAEVAKLDAMAAGTR